MKSINNIKEQYLKIIKLDSNSSLATIEQDIALYKKRINNEIKYFYTNIQGNLLFNKLFQYAAPFSDNKAFIIDDNTKLIIDIDKKIRVIIPDEISKYPISQFRNNNLVIFNNKYGSIEYNDKMFYNNIPFIWDILEFSRKKDYVYIGSSKSTKIVPTIYINKMYAYIIDYYKHMLNLFKYGDNVLKYIDLDALSDVFVSDDYFNECFKDNYNNNSDIVLNKEFYNDYEKVLGLFKT